MNKPFMTKKALVYGEDTILSVGYCEMYHLLIGRSPVAYHSGVYGWNFDAYKVDEVLICTGYRSTPKTRGISDNWEVIKGYENSARRLWENREIPYEKRVDAIRGLLSELLALLKY